MFIGKYEIDNREYFNIYYRNKDEYKLWNSDTFSPNIKNIETLDFKISGKNYEEKKASLKDLAINWQNNYSSLSWSYSELAEINNYFYENGKRYGLLKEFRENAIC